MPKLKPVGEEKLTSGVVPVPLKLTDCGLPEALLGKFREALRAPVADGVNVMLMVHVLPEAGEGVSVAPVQLSALLVKSPAFVPVIVTVEMERLPVPVLVMVSDCAVLVVLTS